MDGPNYVNIDDISLKREEDKGDVEVIASLVARYRVFPSKEALLEAAVTVQK